ncbi:MAG: SpoIIE family protein phosphatase [Lachnospiraceae bacterium]|jgi:hypothetical protein|nr:SpoIIE family protein phosphatase [Lachnospiraceae bacterium]
MTIRGDCACKSLIKFREELCGDKVELLRTEDSYIMILADGMGSGVKANILATLTAKILGTMFLKGASLEECVETIVSTLPVCQVRHVAYSTFSILQVSKDGLAYLVEFDNPACLLIRDGSVRTIPFSCREIAGRRIKEARFPVRIGDTYILVSDGVIHAGVGRGPGFGWSWDNMAAYAVKQAADSPAASRIAHAICQAAWRLYGGRPGDDTTVAVMRITPARIVNLMTGPPKDPADDCQIVAALMEGDARRIVCGGTTATIVSRILNKALIPSLDFPDPDIPPTAHMEGMDLVTEGVLTLNRTVSLLRRYTEHPEPDEAFFIELDKQNGGSRIARILIEDCTDLTLLVGRGINMAHQNPDLPFDLGARQMLVEQLVHLMQAMGRQVTITYY